MRQKVSSQFKKKSIKLKILESNQKSHLLFKLKKNMSECQKYSFPIKNMN